MNNKFNEYYKNIINDNFGYYNLNQVNFKSDNLVETFGALDKIMKIIKKKKECEKLKSTCAQQRGFTTIIENVNYGTCNNSCKKLKTYKSLDRWTHFDPEKETLKEPTSDANNCKTRLCELPDDYLDYDKNIVWKTVEVDCEIGEGDCGQRHCVGDWDECDDNCDKRYKILQPKIGTGDECQYIENEIRKCSPGSGRCPKPPGIPGPKGDKGDKGDTGKSGEDGSTGLT